jgi:hypothetical protein
MHDIRYTLKPEIITPDDAELSGGFLTTLHADGDFVGAAKFGINNSVELGSKVTIQTERRFGDLFAMLDLGAKVALDPGSALQADLLFGINNNRGGGVAIGYTNAKSYSKRFSAVYEGRIGFFDAVTEGNWSVFEIGAYPAFRIADPVTLRMGILQSTSLRHPKDSFQIALLPGFVIGIQEHLQLFAECAVDIIGGNDLRLAAYVTTKF